MISHLEVLLTPAEFSVLPKRDLRISACVVFDILRATSTLLEALAHGAEAIVPVADIPSALALKAKYPTALLAGERDGLRIGAALSGGVEFDFGNSPREFTRERVAGHRIVMTTTNGTRALKACADAGAVLAASLANLKATVRWLEQSKFSQVLLICSGTLEQAAWEDALAAGALLDRLLATAPSCEMDDTARLVLTVYRTRQHELPRALGEGRNGQRLLGLGGLAEDVAYCGQLDRFDFVAVQSPDGAFRRASHAGSN